MNLEAWAAANGYVVVPVVQWLSLCAAAADSMVAGWDFDAELAELLT